MNPRDIFWWLCYLVAAVWLQYFINGVDFLVPGLVVSLQEERRNQSIWLLVVFILVQEGAGTLAFGYAILWYLPVILLFYLGRWLLEEQSLMFIVLLGVFLGLWHFGLCSMLASLQGYEYVIDRLARESVLQGVLFPPAWRVVSKLRARYVARPAF